MNPEPRRIAEFITPPNLLKSKLGEGGLDEAIIAMAQKLIDESSVDFLPIGQRYLVGLQEGLRICATQQGQTDNEALIATMLYPAMQLKANGGMFGYPLVTAVAGRLVKFLEMIPTPDDDALDVVSGFAASLQAFILLGENAEEVSEHGSDLYAALDEACARYFEKHPA